METIIFNNKNALEDLNIWIAKEYVLPFVIEEEEETPIEGRSGTLTTKLGTFPNLNIPLELILIDITDYRSKVRKINKWLTEIEDNKLIFSSYKERCLKVKKVSTKDIEKDILKCGNFTANFLCEPFFYNPSEYQETINNNTTIFNDGDLESQPNLLLEGVSGNISISINGREMQFTSVVGTISINSRLFRAIDGNGQSLTNEMIGKFPILDVGTNLITYVGTIGSFKITKNTIYKG